MTTRSVPRPRRPTPGVAAFGPLIERFDTAVDEQLERVRGHGAVDTVMTTASTLGEFSAIWHGVNLLRGLTGAGRWRQVPRLAILIGAESLVVNQGIKRLFRRARPTTSGDARFDLRTPQTSSFPSGHASSAAFAATVLTRWDGRRSRLWWWPLAATVATSRAYVRVHHASDVIAGLFTGVALARAALRLTSCKR